MSGVDPREAETVLSPTVASGSSCGGRLVVFMTLVFSIIVVLIGAQRMQQFGHRPVVLGEGGEIEVAAGESTTSVLSRMISDGLVRDDMLWPVWMKMHRPGGCMTAGTHQISAGLRPNGVFDELCEPTSDPTITLTIPEGTNVYQIADMMDRHGVGAREDYIDLMGDESFLASLNIDAPMLEGYLAPDTYEFYRASSAEDVLRKLAEHAVGVRSGASIGEVSPMVEGYSLHEILTVASIVEEEAQVAEERATIARVIYNRLATGMQIQCDPTCVYGPDTYMEIPTRSRCRDPESTHSTYVLPGLPPTPISNPGRSAIEAALRPADDPDVLYFVAMRDGTGRHVFADTLEEHNANVDRYLRGR